MNKKKIENSILNHTQTIIDICEKLKTLDILDIKQKENYGETQINEYYKEYVNNIIATIPSHVEAIKSLTEIYDNYVDLFEVDV